MLWGYGRIRNMITLTPLTSLGVRTRPELR